MDNYNELIRVLSKADEDYYLHDRPTLSDSQYDELMRELVQLEQSTGIIAPQSPTQLPSGKFIEGRTVTRANPMLSLDNITTVDEYRKWRKRLDTGLVVCEPKIDGLALEVVWVAGRLVQASTRGDGTVGEDVTDKVLNLLCIPNVLHEPVDLTIRGELYLDKQDFATINRELSLQDVKPYANPRNLASGIFRRVDLTDIRKSKLKFITYDAFHDASEGITDYHSALLRAASLGAPAGSRELTILDKSFVDAHYEDLLAKRPKLDYEIDGMVVKTLKLDSRVTLGASSKSPNWAIAWKFPAIETHTTLLGVSFQVSKVGTITPVARLEPVKLCGALVSRATLHNADELKRLDLHYGDTVVVRRGGDVIPGITAPIVANRKPDAVRVEYPDNCPSCNCKLETSQVLHALTHRCPNYKCPARVGRKLEHFTSKRAMDIRGLAEVTISRLIELGFLKEFSDVFKLTEESLGQLPSFGQRSIASLLKRIEYAKSVKFANLIYALGIPDVGVTTAQDLSKAYPNLRALLNTTVTELLATGATGPAVSETIVKHFSDAKTLDEIVRLLEVGLDIEYPNLNVGGLLLGENWVITGSFPGYSKTALEDLITSHGGRVYSSISGKTDYCLVGDSPGKKLDDALDYNVSIRTLKDLKETIGE